ncbi:MAG: hypothetical protein QME51_04655 [Planctomycetota bacterium]|nr:hypothetical protein [Planctomycetota bacterium]
MATTLIIALNRYRKYIGEDFYTINASAYTTGTVAVTLNSATVTGSGTTFTNNAKAGDTFHISGGKYYHILSVDSATQITLIENYTGSTASGQAYSITGGQVTHATVVDDLNDSQREIVSQVEQWNETYFAVNGTISYVSGTEKYNLPTTNGVVKKVLMVTRTDLSENKELDEIILQDRRRYLATSGTTDVDNQREYFYILGSQIGIVPIPTTTATGNVRIDYLPEATDLGTESSTPTLGEDLAPLWIINAAIKRTTDVNLHALHRRLWTNLEKTLIGRVKSKPRYVRNMTESNF